MKYFAKVILLLSSQELSSPADISMCSLNMACSKILSSKKNIKK